MKLVFCNNCQTTHTPTEVKKTCDCGQTSSILQNDTVHYGGQGVAYDLPITSPEFIRYTDFGSVYDFELSKEKEADRDKVFCAFVIDHLNNRSGNSYRNIESTNSLILARKKETKATLQDFYDVIDKKCAEWMNTDMEKYLRPKTLFNKTNFPNYLGQKYVKRSEPVAKSFEQFASTSAAAKRDILSRSQENK